MTGQTTRAAIRHVQAGLAALFVLFVSLSMALAEEWTIYQLGDVAFGVPAGWYKTYEDPGLTLDLSADDVPYAVRAQWWVPDGPLLGYDDIVSHTEFTLAGRRAMLIVSGFDDMGIYQIVFLEPRADGRQFMFSLDFFNKDFSGAANFLDALLSRLVYEGSGGTETVFGDGSAVTESGPTEPPAPEPIVPGDTGFSGELAYSPIGDLMEAKIGNAGAVHNAPTKKIVLAPTEPIIVHKISTYHWNDGKGRPAAGKIAIQSEDGQVFGPWQATGTSGQGGVPNANWHVAPGVVLVPGKYVVLDSDPKTWSTNDEAGSRGFVTITYQQVEERAIDNSVFWPFGDSGKGGQAEAVPEPQAEPENSGQILFDGQIDERWNAQGALGAKLESLATTERGMLVIDVPEGHGWADAGIASREPLVFPPRVADADELALTIALDPTRTSGLRVGLDPMVNGHRKIVVRLMKDLNTGVDTVILDTGRDVVEAAIEDIGLLDGMSLVMRPEGDILVLDNTGRIIVQSALKDDSSDTGYKLAVTALAPAYKKATRLALGRITLATRPYDRPADPDLFLENEQHLVLFDGEVLGNRWARFEASKPNFADFAGIKDGVLVADVPEGYKWVLLGVYSFEPLIWLDKFEGNAYARITASFDPEKTSSFALALTPYFGEPDYDPKEPNAIFYWRQLAEGGARASLYVDVRHVREADEPAWEIDLPDLAPERVTLQIIPGGIQVLADGMPFVAVPWEQAVPGQGFRVYAFTQPNEYNQPAKMALRRITLDRGAGSAEPARPEAGVPPLPTKVLFAGSPDPLWEPSGVGTEDFAGVRFENGRLVAGFAPETLKDGRLGLVSTAPIISLDERIKMTSYRLEAKIDPKASSGFEMGFYSKKVADMRGDRTAGFSLIRHEAGRLAGKYVLELREGGSARSIWRRLIDADWVENVWDGTFEITLGNSMMSVHLAGGPGVGAPGFFKEGDDRFATVYAAPENKAAGAQMVLERITGGWVTPDGMNALDRWLLLDAVDFDGEAFATDLAAGMNRNTEALENQWLLNAVGDTP